MEKHFVCDSFTELSKAHCPHSLFHYSCQIKMHDSVLVDCCVLDVFWVAILNMRRKKRVHKANTGSKISVALE